MMERDGKKNHPCNVYNEGIPVTYDPHTSEWKVPDSSWLREMTFLRQTVKRKEERRVVRRRGEERREEEERRDREGNTKVGGEKEKWWEEKKGSGGRREGQTGGMDWEV